MTMIDDRHRLWASVVVGVASLTSVTTLLMVGVDVASIVASFAALGVLINLYLVSEVAKVKTLTNGNIADMQSQIKELTDHAKRSVPIEDIATLTGGPDNGR